MNSSTTLITGNNLVIAIVVCISLFFIYLEATGRSLAVKKRNESVYGF